MAIQYYVMPQTTQADGSLAPKYKDLVTSKVWANIYFGNEGHCILAADVSPTDDTAIRANGDVQAIPADIDQNLKAAGVTQVTAALEARNIPSDWVSTALTWRQLLKYVCIFFLFAQRFSSFNAAKIFQSGVTLSTTYGSLPAGVKTALVSAAQSFNFDTSGVTASTTIRQLLRLVADQWSANNPIFLLNQL